MITIARDTNRDYASSHPWITFALDLNRLDHRTWMLLGEAASKCEHVAGAPLQPDVATRLHLIYLSKGVHGTTSIEGNTLSEDETLALVRDELRLPPSRQYLGKMSKNIVDACNTIMWDIHEGQDIPLTPERIATFNKLVLAGLELDDDVEPGAVRTHSVVVANGTYRGAPARDCEYLLERLCRWLEVEFTTDDPVYKFSFAVLKAIMAHLYIAWIHPFGDGNGRTARLVEFQLLAEAGIPTPAAHLLSNHYNMTRDAYYRTLAKLSRAPYPVEEFIQYAMVGFVDGLRAQIEEVRSHQLDITWQHFVHETFSGQDTKAPTRQKHLVLDLPTDAPTPIGKIPALSARLAVEYQGKGPKTISRDVNALESKGLITRGRRGVLPRKDSVRAFLPFKAPTGLIGEVEI